MANLDDHLKDELCDHLLELHAQLGLTRVRDPQQGRDANDRNEVNPVCEERRRSQYEVDHEAKVKVDRVACLLADQEVRRSKTGIPFSFLMTPIGQAFGMGLSTRCQAGVGALRRRGSFAAILQKHGVTNGPALAPFAENRSGCRLPPQQCPRARAGPAVDRPWFPRAWFDRLRDPRSRSRHI